ncbi:MAG: hypothetical protein HEQ35_12655 [Gloeotrichia echinulata IR180]|jgi:hypothetical protein|nr:hypothetical protein [Gloeotrichia echinulata DEX184]
MIPTPQPQSPQDSQSKPAHPLARFVTPEAVALLLKIKVEQIKEIRLWPNVILVIAKNLVRFVSYADLPPIIEVEPPTAQDFVRWRKRWHKSQTKLAPDFWHKFYQQKFSESANICQLYTWGQLVRVIKFAISTKNLELLRHEYLTAKSKFQPA